MSYDKNRVNTRGLLYRDLQEYEGSKLKINVCALTDGYIGDVISGSYIDLPDLLVSDVSDGEASNGHQMISSRPYGRFYNFGKNYISLATNGMMPILSIPDKLDEMFIDYLMENSKILKIYIGNGEYYGFMINCVISFLGQTEGYCGFKFDFLCLEKSYGLG